MFCPFAKITICHPHVLHPRIDAKQTQLQLDICCSIQHHQQQHQKNILSLTLSPPEYSNFVHWSSPLPRSLWHPYYFSNINKIKPTSRTQSHKSIEDLRKIWHLLERLRLLEETQMSKWKHCCKCCVIEHSSKRTGVVWTTDRGRRRKAQPPPPPMFRSPKSSFQVEFLIVLTF